jgi:hypothetical protein
VSARRRDLLGSLPAAALLLGTSTDPASTALAQIPSEVEAIARAITTKLCAAWRFLPIELREKRMQPFEAGACLNNKFRVERGRVLGLESAHRAVDYQLSGLTVENSTVAQPSKHRESEGLTNDADNRSAERIG